MPQFIHPERRTKEKLTGLLIRLVVAAVLIMLLLSVFDTVQWQSQTETGYIEKSTIRTEGGKFPISVNRLQILRPNGQRFTLKLSGQAHYRAGLLLEYKIGKRKFTGRKAYLALRTKSTLKPQ